MWVTAIVCFHPLFTCTTRSPASASTCCTRTTSSLWPTPHCPNLFQPDANRRPWLSAAIVCRQPPATVATCCTASTRFGT